jgi:succinate dehydrogenase / fumarate reductase, cytochrome b subunit
MQAMQQRSVWGRALRRWFDPRGRNISLLGFILFRLSGLGLTLYLAAHFVALSNLVRGPEAWASFLELAHTPLFMLFDIVLIAGILVHGLNGLRVALIGLGFGTRNHKAWFYAAMAAAVVVLVWAGVRFISLG